MSSLFFDALPSRCSSLYKKMYWAQGDEFDTVYSNARQHCEDLWSDFRSLADENFRREFAEHTHERWFEMYLTVSLVRAGYQVDCPKPGPDVLLDVDGRRVWVEAVCASSGKADLPDSVPKRQFGQVVREPTDQYVLRIRNSLEEKQKKYLHYFESGIVCRGDMVVVAINVYAVDGPGPYIDDHIKRSLYGVGDATLQFDRRSRSIVGVGHKTVLKVKKSSGASVGVQPFTDGSMAHVSAVLASHASALNLPDQLGGDFVLYPNLSAEKAWPHGILRLGSEWRFEEREEVGQGVRVETVVND